MKSTTLPNSLEVLSLFLPSGCLDYFDVTAYSNMDTCYIISLEEKNVIPYEYADLPLVSKGFHPEIEVQDFPARARPFIFISSAVVGRIKEQVKPIVVIGI